MTLRRTCFFLLLIYTTCFSYDLPKEAPLSTHEWAMCEHFIQTQAEAYFSDRLFCIPTSPTLPCPITKDPKTGSIFIHLKGREGALIGRGSHKLVTKSMVSGPEELPLWPLAERCGSLSTHTAPIRQTLLAFRCASVQIVSAFASIFFPETSTLVSSFA